MPQHVVCRGNDCLFYGPVNGMPSRVIDAYRRFGGNFCSQLVPVRQKGTFRRVVGSSNLRGSKETQLSVTKLS